MRAFKWLRFFFNKKGKYFFAGRLSGKYFDGEGKATTALRAFEECAGIGGIEEMARKVEEEVVAESVAAKERLFTREELKEAKVLKEKDDTAPILLA